MGTRGVFGKIQLMFALLAATLTQIVLTNAADLASALRQGVSDARFNLRGTITYAKDSGGTIALEDSTGAVSFYAYPNVARTTNARPGDLVSVTGYTEKTESGHGIARSSALSVIGHGVPPVPREIDAAELVSGQVDNRIVRIHGVIREVFRDEIDPPFVIFTLCCQKETVYAAFCAKDLDMAPFEKLTDAEVSITGLCMDNDFGTRGQLGHLVNFKDPSAITVHRRPSDDIFAVPELSDTLNTDPAVIATMTRRRIVGRVQAVWAGRRMLLSDARGFLHNVALSDAALPAIGSTVEAVGIPETDLFRVNLQNAVWRPRANLSAELPRPEEIPFAELFADDHGNRRINSLAHGKLTCATGEIVDIADGDGVPPGLTLKCGDHSLPVDASAVPDALVGLSVGCKVRVSGLCLVMTETWRPYARFPHAQGIIVTLRSAGDLRIISRPPWWTPRRLMAVIGSLLAALIAILAWNRILNRVIVRRSRQLLREELAHRSAELRIDERTRLAIELHDSLSQNLSGLACQITAVKRSMPATAVAAAEKLDIAERMLFSSRTELKRCLWDLRGNMLECRDMTEAVRNTVQPAIGETALVVRFNVPRSRLTDSVTHSILCIVRELAANAVRHGQATHIQVAGTLDGGSIAFSVRDNGRGFDVAHHAGVAEGHFGLSGIRERVERLNGSLDLESSPETGTSARIRIPLDAAT